MGAEPTLDTSHPPCEKCGKPLQGAPFDGDGGPTRWCWECGHPQVPKAR